MSKIPEHLIQDIRSKAKIEEIIGHYLPIEKAGNNYKAVCPFHDDHDPSLSISPSKQIYKCFVCHAGGNVFNFVSQYEQVSFTQAVVKVADMVGIHLDPSYQKAPSPQRSQAEARNYECVKAANDYLMYVLGQTLNESPRNFLLKRQLTADICQRFLIGYNDPILSLSNYLLQKGFSEVQCIENHLSYLADEKLIDVFSNRITFAICNENGEPIAFTARTLGQSDSKYINTKTTDIYQKSAFLYNFHQAKQLAYKDEPLILCEGVMDVIGFFKAGFHKVVATLGTALSEQQIALLKQFNSTVILAFDGDKAGQNAIYQIGSACLANNIKVSIYNNQTTLDPDEIVSAENGSLQLRKMIEQPVNWYQFCLKYAIDLYSLHSYEDKKKIIAFYLPLLKRADQLDKAYYLSQLSEVTGFETSQLSQMVAPMRTTIKFGGDQKNVYNQLLDSQFVETQILAYLLAGKKYDDLYFLHLGYLLSESADGLALLIHHKYQKQDKVLVADCLNESLTLAQRDILIEINSNEFYSFKKNEASFVQLLMQIKRFDLSKQLQQTKQQLKQCQDPSQIVTLIQKISSLEQEHQALLQGETNEKIQNPQ